MPNKKEMVEDMCSRISQYYDKLTYEELRQIRSHIIERISLIDSK